MLVIISIFLVRPNLNQRVYHSHVVYPKTIEVLEALDTVSQPDDFVVTWWDYGSGVGFTGGQELLRHQHTKLLIIFNI